MNYSYFLANICQPELGTVFYKAMRLLSQVKSFLRDHLVIGKQVLGRKWNATIDQIHCQKEGY